MCPIPATNGAKSADNGDKTGNDYGFSAIFLEEMMGFLQNDFA